MIKISIIIPVYNADKYLSNTLNCLLTQTLKELEVICINDCSTDNSIDILNRYSKQDSRIKVIDLTENIGAASARNRGLEIAQGEYLGFVDSDDEIDLNFYEKLYQKATETNSDIVKAGCKITELDGSSKINNLNEIIEKTNKYRFTWQWWSAIYRKSLIKDNSIKFPDECIQGEDCVFLNKAILKANNVETINDVFYHYIRREGSLDSQELSSDKINSTILARKHMLDNINSSDLSCQDKDSYNYLYNLIMTNAINFLFRTHNIELKTRIVKEFIENYQNMKDKESLNNNFPYPMLLNLIKDKNYSALSEFLIECKNEKELKYGRMSFCQKVFSIQPYGRNKLLTVLGIRIKIKR